MLLIIAEKPSLARNIADAIGNMKKETGYMQGEKYVVSWAFGHLFSLCDIEHYTGEDPKTRWHIETLPCLPDAFDFELRRESDGKVDSGVKKQFETLKKLIGRPDIEGIVNAGDADREGEIIVRLCIENAVRGNEETSKKPVYRLWLPDQTAETIRSSLSDLKEDKEYDSLASEGFARTYIDWLYGVNLTRFATLKTGTLLRVGRVIVPIVKAIYDRDMAIRNFVPGKYLLPVSKKETKGIVLELASAKKFEENEKEKAEALSGAYNKAGAVVTSVSRKKETLFAGKLYSLTKLQNYLGKKYKMPMEKSLAVVQDLYEKGFLTYPRTNSEYLASAEKDKFRQIVAGVAKIGYPVRFKDSKYIFDDSKIESHSALTPTYKIPKKEDLTKDQQTVYGAVMRRFVAVFCSEDCVVSRTKIGLKITPDAPFEPEEFELKGTVVLEPGWTKYDDSTLKDKMLPPLEKGEAVEVDFKPVEKETSPPKHYTIETLNNYLKNPFRQEKAAAKEQKEDPDAENPEISDAEDYRAIFEGLELGTEATRTGIIDNAKKSGYIELKKDVYTILPAGEFLITSLEQMKISMDKYKTAELGKALKQVFHGDLTVKDSVSLAKDQIVAVFDLDKENADGSTGFFGDTVGKCPKCGKNVSQRGRFYGCEGYKDGCKFTINTYICGKAIPMSAVSALLEGKKTEILTGFISKKSGKFFDAALLLDEDGKVKFDFPERQKKASASGNPPDYGYGFCPKCGAPLIMGKKKIGCSAWKSGCDFVKDPE